MITDLKGLDERLINYVLRESKSRNCEPHVIVSLIVENTGELRAATKFCEPESREDGDFTHYNYVFSWAIALQETGRQFEL